MGDDHPAEFSGSDLQGIKAQQIFPKSPKNGVSAEFLYYSSGLC